jgi:tripartite-type tricarboxylate transporter receptor subunit TctC
MSCSTISRLPSNTSGRAACARSGSVRQRDWTLCPTFAGIGAPKDTAASIVDKLNAEVNAGLADPMIKAGIVELGGAPMPLAVADFGKLIAEETEKWAKVIRTANISVE